MAQVREKLKILFHPDSEAMRSFEHGDEEGMIEVQPATDFDPESALPFAGLDAPLGG